jgi:hypothetical protein
MVTVSGSCLLGNLRINYYASNASRISGRKDDSTSTIVELLIGPCKAEELSHLVTIRSKYSVIRRDVNYLLTMLTALQNDPGTSNRSPRAFSGDSSSNMKLSPATSFYYSSNKVDYSAIRPSSASSASFSSAAAAVIAHQTQSSKSRNRLSSFSSESINQDGSYEYQRNSNNTSNISEDLLLKVRSIASCLEFNYQFLLANEPSFSSSSSSTSASGTVSSSLFSDSLFLFEWEKTYISLLYNYVRTNIISNFFLQFPFLLSSSELPAYSFDCIKAVLDHDIEESQLLTTIKENIIRIESVKERFQVFLNNSIDTLRDFILFSAKVTFSDPKNASFCQFSLPLPQLTATSASSSLTPTPSQSNQVTNHLSTAACSAPFPISSSLLLIPFQIMQELTSDLRSFDAVKSPLEYLILQYYSTIQKGLQLYDLFEKEKYFKSSASSASSTSSTSSAFNKHLKAILLSFLIEYNYEFYEKCLLLFEINYSMIHIEPKLILHSSLVDLIQWFYLENFHESKQMIYKAFHPSPSTASSSSTVKQSSQSHSQSQGMVVGDNRCWWNVDYNLDGYYVSSIPETVQSYLSFYIELYQSLKRPNIVMMNRCLSSSSSSSAEQVASGFSSQRPPSFTSRNTSNNTSFVNNDNSSNNTTTNVSYYGKLCKKILLLMHNSWLIVGNEYYHVSQVTYQEFFSTNHKLIASLSSSTSSSSMTIALQAIITKHVSFLLSIVNDCWKIENEFIPIMKDLSNYLLVSSFNNNNSNLKYKNGMEIILKTLKNDSYDVIIEQVLLMICQMMCCGVSSYLLAFDSFWLNQNVNSKNAFQPTYCVTIICENFLFYLNSIRSMMSSASHLLAFVYLTEETIISRYFLLFQNSLKQHTMKHSSSSSVSSSSISFSQEQLQQFRKDFLYFKDFFEKIENDLKNKILQSNPLLLQQLQGKKASSSWKEGTLFLSSTLQWNLSPLTYFEHFVSLLLEPISSFSFNQSLRFLVSKYDNDATNFTNHDISLFLDYFLLHIILPLHSSSVPASSASSSSSSSSSTSHDKQALYDYFIKILDGNQEDIYRQTNSFLPIHINSASVSSRENDNSSGNGNGNGNGNEELNEEELENQFFKRDLFWRIFSSELCRHNFHDSSLPAGDDPPSVSSVRNDGEGGGGVGGGGNDIIQNVFKGLFQHHTSKGGQEENNSSSSSNLTSSSKKGKKSFTKKLGMKQTKAIVQNIRDSASDFIHLMNFSSSTSLSIDTHHHKINSNAIGEISYDLESIFRLLGLEVLPYDISSDYRNIAEERDPATSSRPHSIRQSSFRDLHHQTSASALSNLSGKGGGGGAGIAESTSQGENNSGSISTRVGVSRGESLKTPQTNANPGKGLFSTFFSPSLRLRDESKVDDPQQEGLTIQKSSPSPKNGSSIPTPATGGGMNKTPSIKKALSFFDESDSSILVDSPMKASSHHPSENSSPDRHNQNHGHRADVSIATNKLLSASSSSTNVLPSSSFSLTISHISVQGVHSHGLFSSKANPYAYFLIPRFQVKEKTTVAYNCNQAYFPGTLTLSFSFFSPFTSPSLPIVVQVYDKEKIRRKQLIGWNEINLFDYFSSSLSQERKGTVFGRSHQDDENHSASVSLLLRNPDSYENSSVIPSSSVADAYGKMTFEMLLTKK